MPHPILSTTIAAYLLMLSATWINAEPPSVAKWSIGEPIVTYWAGPGADKPLTQQQAAQVRAGGWNLGWARSITDLDILHDHAMRGMLVIGTPNIDEPEQAKALGSLIEQAREHPALYAYHLVDEPGAGAFPKLGKLVAFLRQHDPAHLAYINLLPTYASDGQLQVSDDTAERARVGYPQDFAGISTDDKTSLRYREHLRQFIETVQPSSSATTTTTS